MKQIVLDLTVAYDLGNAWVLAVYDSFSKKNNPHNSLPRLSVKGHREKLTVRAQDAKFSELIFLFILNWQLLAATYWKLN